MLSIDAAPATIPPFWQRLNRFFLFPLQTEALTYGLGLAACSLFIYIPLLNLVIFPVIMLAMSRYAFKIAALSSFGIFSLGDYTPMEEEEDWKKLPWKFVGAVFVQLLVLGFFAAKIPEIAPIGFLLFSLLMPATLMVLIRDHSLRAAINPLELWRCIQGVGWPYLVLCAFTFLLMQGSATASGMLGEIVPRWLLLPGLMLVFIYFSWVNAALIGYTMYQYHRALDIDVVNEYQGDVVSVRNPREQARQRDAAVSHLVQQGKMPDALAQAQQWLREWPENLPEHRRYHRLLLLGGDAQELLRHGQRFVELLLKKLSPSEALQVYKACVQKNPGFVPDGAVVTLMLAKYAWKTHDSMLALHILRNFERRYPGHVLMPTVYALIVRVLHQGLQRREQAISVLRGLQQRYPEDPHTHEAARILRD